MAGITGERSEKKVGGGNGGGKGRSMSATSFYPLACSSSPTTGH